VASDAPADVDSDDEESMPASPLSPQDGIRAVQQAFSRAATPVRWPMYVRQARQFLRSAIENFDERKYGFASVVDLLRAAGKEGVLRVERDRQGAVRVFPGANLTARPASVPPAEVDTEPGEVDLPPEAVRDLAAAAEVAVEQVTVETITEAPVIEADIVEKPRGKRAAAQVKSQRARVKAPVKRAAAGPRRKTRVPV
jgi:hypothetical protein